MAPCWPAGGMQVKGKLVVWFVAIQQMAETFKTLNIANKAAQLPSLKEEYTLH